MHHVQNKVVLRAPIQCCEDLEKAFDYTALNDTYVAWDFKQRLCQYTLQENDYKIVACYYNTMNCSTYPFELKQQKTLDTIKRLGIPKNTVEKALQYQMRDIVEVLQHGQNFNLKLITGDESSISYIVSLMTKEKYGSRNIQIVEFKQDATTTLCDKIELLALYSKYNAYTSKNYEQLLLRSKDVVAHLLDKLTHNGLRFMALYLYKISSVYQYILSMYERTMQT